MSDVATEAREAITEGRTALGIELGSTRIKAVLIGPDYEPLAVGSSRLGEPVRRPALDLPLGRGLVWAPECFSALAATLGNATRSS